LLSFVSNTVLGQQQHLQLLQSVSTSMSKRVHIFASTVHHIPVVTRKRPQ